MDHPQQFGQIARLGGAYGIGQPVPDRHGVPVDQQGLGLGGPHRRDARLGEPERDAQFPARPVEEFGVAAHLDHQVAGGEHRVLAQRESRASAAAAGQHPRRGQYVPRPCLVHRPPPVSSYGCRVVVRLLRRPGPSRTASNLAILGQSRIRTGRSPVRGALTAVQRLQRP